MKGHGLYETRTVSIVTLTGDTRDEPDMLQRWRNVTVLHTTDVGISFSTDKETFFVPWTAVRSVRIEDDDD